jgi:WD40 repeat protein
MLILPILSWLVWSVPTRADNTLPSKHLKQEGAVELVAVDPAGSWIITGGSDGNVRLWNLRTQELFAKRSFILRGHHQPIRLLAITRDGQWLASGSSDGMVRLWNLASRDPSAMSQELSPSELKARSKDGGGWILEMSGNSRWLIGRGADLGRTKVWDLHSQDPKAKSIVLETGTTLELCPNHRWLVSDGGYHAEKTQVWDLDAADPWSRAATFQRPRRTPLDVISPNGRWVVARHRDEMEPTKDQIFLWDLKEKSPTAKILITHKWPTPPRAGGISPDGRWLAITFDFDDKPYPVDLWDLRNDDPPSRHLIWPGHENTIRKLVFSPNSRWMVPVQTTSPRGFGTCERRIPREVAA